jgi:hypothetical protein
MDRRGNSEAATVVVEVLEEHEGRELGDIYPVDARRADTLANIGLVKLLTSDGD